MNHTPPNTSQKLKLGKETATHKAASSPLNHHLLLSTNRESQLTFHLDGNSTANVALENPNSLVRLFSAISDTYREASVDH